MNKKKSHIYIENILVPVRGTCGWKIHKSMKRLYDCGIVCFCFVCYTEVCLEIHFFSLKIDFLKSVFIFVFNAFTPIFSFFFILSFTQVEGTLSVQPQANPVMGFEKHFLGLTVENNQRNPWFVGK